MTYNLPSDLRRVYILYSTIYQVIQFVIQLYPQTFGWSPTIWVRVTYISIPQKSHNSRIQVYWIYLPFQGQTVCFQKNSLRKTPSFTYRIHVKYSYHIFTLQCITLNKCTLHLLPVTLCLYSFGRFHGGRHQVFPTRCRKPLESCPRPPVPLPCEGWKGSGSEKVKVVKYHPTVGFPKNRAFPKNHPHKKKTPFP